MRQIMNRHPRLYRLARRGPMHSSMCFGFQCGPGWARILGWVTTSFKAAWCLLRFDARATTVKEKLGGLRFYWHCLWYPRWMPRLVGDLVTRALWWVEARAEDLSYRVCEDCGAPGRPNPRGWIATLCEPCRARKRVRELEGACRYYRAHIEGLKEKVQEVLEMGPDSPGARGILDRVARKEWWQ